MTVTIAVALVYVSGILNVIVGVIVLLSRYHVVEPEMLTVSLIGAAIILFGLLSIAIASALARGSRAARLFATLYLAAQFALHIATIVSADVWDWAEAVQMLTEVVIVVALWAPPGSRFFRAAKALNPTGAAAD